MLPVRGPQSVDADRDIRQLLADVVVQIAGDVGARRFLGVDEAAGHVPDAIVAGAQRRFARPDRVVGAAQPRALPQQPGDQQQLRDHDDDRRHDVGAVQFPRGRHAEADVRARGKQRLVDAPAPQLPPVEHRPDAAPLRWECSGRRTLQDAERHLAETLGVGDAAAHHAADHALAEIRVEARCKSAPARPRRSREASRRERSRGPWSPASSARRRSGCRRATS